MLILKFRFFDTRATNDDSVVTRQSLGRAPLFRRWVLDEFAPYLGSRVLEVNAGPGHTTSHLLDREHLVATDSDPVHLETLRRRFGHLENLDIVQNGISMGPDVSGRFDTIVLFDGMQRAEHPSEFLRDAASALEAGGHVLIQVPARPELAGPIDASLGHLHRFTRDRLVEVVESAGLEVREIKGFNRVGSLAWKSYARRGKVRVSVFSARLFDFLVPFLRVLDPLLPFDGLSWLVVARKP